MYITLGNLKFSFIYLAKKKERFSNYNYGLDNYTINYTKNMYYNMY